jgi:hypothetical protein
VALVAEHSPIGAIIVDLWNQLQGIEELRSDVTVVALGRMNVGVN